MATTTHSQKAWLVQVKDLTAIYFQKLTAPKINFETYKFTDASKGLIRTHVGFPDPQPVTLSLLYDPKNPDHVAFISFCDSVKKGEKEPFVVTCTPVKIDASGSVAQGARSVSLTGCQVTSITYPGSDRESNSPSMMELELTPEDVTMQ